MKLKLLLNNEIIMKLLSAQTETEIVIAVDIVKIDYTQRSGKSSTFVLERIFTTTGSIIFTLFSARLRNN